MNKLLAVITALFLGIASAENYVAGSDVFGPIAAEQNIEPKIEISIASPYGKIHFGDEVTLMCSVEGMDGVDYTIDWQYCTCSERSDFINLNCHELLYTFVITRENVDYCYRVVISQK